MLDTRQSEEKSRRLRDIPGLKDEWVEKWIGEWMGSTS